MSLTFEIDVPGEVEFDALGEGGYAKPGYYHAVVEDVEYKGEDNKTPSIKIKFKCLAGTNEQSIGAMHFEDLYLSEKSKNRVLLFAKVLGLIDRAQVGGRVKVDWVDTMNRECIIQLTEEETKKDGKPTGKTRVKMEYSGIYALDDERVADVPRKGGARKVDGGSVGTVQPRPTPAPEPATDSKSKALADL